MCVIITIEDGKFPGEKVLKSAESMNPDGGGVAWLEKGQLYYRKGIDSSQIQDLIDGRFSKNNVKTAIIHFRITSVGQTTKELCHPFPITNKWENKLVVNKSKNSFLFHNGTVSNWQELLIEGAQKHGITIPPTNLSDTRVMARLAAKNGIKMLEKIVGWNKFAILTKRGIKKYGDWVKVGENYCSNDYFDQTNQYAALGSFFPGIKHEPSCTCLKCTAPPHVANCECKDCTYSGAWDALNMGYGLEELSDDESEAIRDKAPSKEEEGFNEVFKYVSSGSDMDAWETAAETFGKSPADLLQLLERGLSWEEILEFVSAETDMADEIYHGSEAQRDSDDQNTRGVV